MLKKIGVSVCFVVCVLFMQVSGFATNEHLNYGPFASIEEYENGAKCIYTADDLMKIKDDLTASYVLMNDIDMSDLNSDEWTPIGDLAEPFTGVFDGQGYSINNLKITTDNVCMGLFGAVDKAEIKNLGLKNVSISSEYTLNTDDRVSVYAGGLCGNANNTNITNCNVSGMIDVSMSSKSYLSNVYAGGLCGYFSGSMENSYNEASVKASSTSHGTAHTGGICGESGRFEKCYNAGKVTTIASRNSNSAIAGGICGSYGQFVNCYNVAEVSAYNPSATTPLVGGTIIPFSTAGGIGGHMAESIVNCYNIGAVYSVCNRTFKSVAYGGSICGTIENSATVLNSFWNIDVLPDVNGSKTEKGIGEGEDNTIAYSTEKMKNSLNFNEWDFEYIWGVNEDINNGYPSLQDFYNRSPEILSKTSVENGGVMVYVNCENHNKADLIVVVSDNTSKVEKILIKPVRQSGSVFFENLKVTENTIVDAMLWNKDKPMFPLCIKQRLN